MSEKKHKKKRLWRMRCQICTHTFYSAIVSVLKFKTWAHSLWSRRKCPICKSRRVVKSEKIIKKKGG